MRVAIISDVHGNLAALEGVIADMREVDAVWCLGDIVGYGPDPQACVDRVRALAQTAVVGNHDLAAVGQLDLLTFNDLAAESAEWTARQLDADARDYLTNLPLREVRADFQLVHGSPRDPVWEYLSDPSQAADNFACFVGLACFVGHTHVPVGFSCEPGDDDGLTVQTEPVRYGKSIDLRNRRHILNVGSVGQPRDGDPRARYVILDTEIRAYERRRVVYDVARTQERLRVVGAHPLLAARLERGR